MNVKTLIPFFDRDKMVDREVGDEFVVTKARFDAINAVGEERIGKPLVEEVVTKAVAAKQTPESRAKKAPAKRRQAAKKA